MNNKDILIRASAADNTIRCIATITTQLVNEACQRHGCAMTASAALGRTLTGTLMMGSMLKELERITVKIQCKGPLGNITAEADGQGTVRGYLRNPSVELPVNAQGKLDVSGAVGEGTLYVIRDAGFEIGLKSEGYYGSVPITSGEISYDLAYYWTQSEQVPSIVSLGVFVEPSYEVTAAGGLIIQRMPGADDEIVDQIMASAAAAPSITQMISQGFGPVEMLRTALGPVAFEVLDSRPVQFACKCSEERVLSMVEALGKDEIIDMIAKDQGAKITCHFCSTTYEITEAQLQALLDK